MLKAIAFDMDETLLSINLSAFCYVYLRDEAGLLASIARKHPLAFFVPFSRAFLAMFDADRTDDLTNRALFDAEIERRCGVPLADPVIADALRYYEESVLPERNDRMINARPREGAREAVEGALSRGLRVALLTNPSCSDACIRTRMRWGAIDDLPFEVVTTMENTTRCKPSARYYREALARMGLEPSEVMMVGNDPKRDFALPDCGLETAYVGSGSPDRAFWRGSMAEFSENMDRVIELWETRAAEKLNSNESAGPGAERRDAANGD